MNNVKNGNYNNCDLLSITKYIVEKHNIKLSVKLQKILYFLYLEYLKENNKKLFKEQFEAWVYGPVIPKVFYYIQEHGFDFSEYYDYDEDKIVTVKSLEDKEIKKFIDDSIKKYKNNSTEELVKRSHETFPWVNARNGIDDTQPSRAKIKINDLKKFAKECHFS